MRKWLVLLCAMSFAASAQSGPHWWLGFIDSNERAFLEIPAATDSYAQRDAMVRKAAALPGQVLPSRLNPALQIARAAKLTFGVSDLAGRSRERVMTRVVAIARDAEGARLPLSPPCWFLAEAGTDAPGYRATEDRIAIGVHPPRKLALRVLDQNWRSYGALAMLPGADSRFADAGEMPAALRDRVAALLPQATQLHAQAFSATLDAARGPEPLWLIGGIDRGEAPAEQAGTYNTVNLIVRDGAATAQLPPLYRAGPSGGIVGNRAGSFILQVAAAVDLDGDGTDELLVRARYYAGGNLKLLRWNGLRFVASRQGGYEGE